MSDISCAIGTLSSLDPSHRTMGTPFLDVFQRFFDNFQQCQGYNSMGTLYRCDQSRLGILMSLNQNSVDEFRSELPSH